MSTAIKKASEELKSGFHSLNKEERHKAIEDLRRQNSVDATRELIQVFHDSQWRETRLYVVAQLGYLSDQRSFEFLTELVADVRDLHLAEKAVKSLGQLNQDLARLYLVQLYKKGPKQLRPSVVAALAAAQEPALMFDFVADLKNAEQNNENYLAKNIIYALGELKCFAAKETLLHIIQHSAFRDLSLASLMALGKISRDPSEFSLFEARFSEDFLEHQIFMNARNQATLRSGWKAEDYLQKIFESPSYHKAMPFELNSFPPEDIKAGLELFVSGERSPLLLDVLSKLNFTETLSWYQSYISAFDAEVGLSLSRHYSDTYKDFIFGFKDIEKSHWLRLVVCCLPAADKHFGEIFVGKDYAGLAPEFKINVINEYVHLGFIHGADAKKSAQIEKQLEELLMAEKAPEVQARLVRAFAQLRLENFKVTQFVKTHLFRPELVSSSLYYFEKARPAGAFELLELLSENELTGRKHAASLLAAVRVQKADLLKSKKVETYLKQLLPRPELLKDLLAFAAAWPFAALKETVLGALKHTEAAIQIYAVIAVKKYQDEKTADLLAPVLQSGTESVRGRALDSLLGLPGLRAKRLAFDFFIDHLSVPEVVEQVCRRFEPPANGADYFYKKLTEKLGGYPAHPRLDELLELKEKLFSNLQEYQSQPVALPDSEVLALDRELSKKINSYDKYDDSVKSALRSAELPFVHPEMFTTFVDKSASILGYSKALDIVLEKHLGRKLLFPRLEGRLHEFQNVIHLLELNDSHASGERVIRNLCVEKDFSSQSLPLHKINLVAQGIMNGKIIHEHFKVLDGLRAWTVILLLFCRKTPRVPKAVVPLDLEDAGLVQMAKKLMWVQDLRNPAAHRQTLSDFKAVEQVRSEVFDLLNSLNKMLKNKPEN